MNQPVHPGKLTWNLKMNPWKRRFLLETIIFRFHVSFRGGILECEFLRVLSFGFLNVPQYVNVWWNLRTERN